MSFINIRSDNQRIMGTCSSSLHPTQKRSQIKRQEESNRRIIRPSPETNILDMPSQKEHEDSSLKSTTPSNIPSIKDEAKILQIFINKPWLTTRQSSLLYPRSSAKVSRYFKQPILPAISEYNKKSGGYYLIEQDSAIEGKYATIHLGFRSGNDVNEPIIVKIYREKDYMTVGHDKLQKDQRRLVPMVDTFNYKGFPVVIMPRYDTNLQQICHSFFMNQLSLMNIMHQLAEGVACLHKQGNLLLDLKEENVMIEQLENLSIKIVDFGNGINWRVLKKSSHIKMNQLDGTHNYMAPERYYQKKSCQVIESSLSQNDFSLSNLLKVDVWSMGIILFRLLTKHQSPLIESSRYINKKSFFQRNYTRFQYCLIQLPVWLHKYINQCLLLLWYFLLWVTLAYQSSARIDSQNLFKIMDLFHSVFSADCLTFQNQLEVGIKQARKDQSKHISNNFLCDQMAQRRMDKNLREKQAATEERILNQLRKWIDNKEVGQIHQKLGWIVVCQELERQIISFIHKRISENYPNFKKEFDFIRQNIESQRVDFCKITSILEKDSKIMNKQDLKIRIQILISWYICISEGESYMAKLKRRQSQIEAKIERQFLKKNAKWWIQWLKKQSKTPFDIFNETNFNYQAQYFEKIWQNLQFSQNR